MSSNLPDGVTDQQLEELYTDDPICCGETMELWDNTKYGPVFKCLTCGKLDSNEPDFE